MKYRSTKTYGHNVGLSACFRQWRASHSHCRFMHGYALAFRFEFEADELDHRNWVVDFGSLKPLKAKLEAMFDHQTVVAQDDPQLAVFHEMENFGLIQLQVLEAVGCEAFAKLAYDMAVQVLQDIGQAHRVRVHSVECREHEGNSAIYCE